MSKKKAEELGFEFIYYNPYVTRKDRHFFPVLFVISLVILIVGLNYNHKIFLIINSVILLAQLAVISVDMLTSERIR